MSKFSRFLTVFNLKVFCKIPRPLWMIFGTLIQAAMLFKIFSLSNTHQFEEMGIMCGIFLTIMGIYIMRLWLENPRVLYKFFKTYKHKDIELNQEIDSMLKHVKTHLKDNDVPDYIQFKVQDKTLVCRLQRHFDYTDIVISEVDGESVGSSLSAYRMLLSFYLKQKVTKSNDMLPLKEALIHIW